MNILITTDYFPPHLGGGVEKVVFHLSRELARLGHNVSVVTLRTAGGKTIDEIDDVRVYRAESIPLTNLLGFQSTLSTNFTKLFASAIRNEAPQVIHAHNIFFFTTVVSVLLKMWTNIPLVTTQHVASTSALGGGLGAFTHLYERSVGACIIRRSNRLIAVSQAVREYLCRLGAEEKRTRVISNAVDLDEFYPPRERKQQAIVRVVFVGRLIGNKGVDRLIEAVPSVVRRVPNVEFEIVGDGPLRAFLRHRIIELGLDRTVILMGVVPSVADILRKSDLLVRPSLTEGMPLTVLEAMACGLPCIATAVGGTPEVIQHRKTGILIREGDHQELVDSIVDLVGNHELRRRLGENARHFVENFYSWSRAAEDTIKVYEDVLRETHSIAEASGK